jgi:hypothetical protein
LPSQESPEVVERQIRSLLMEGRILDAQDLLAAVGPDVPIHPKLREVLAPPKIRTVDERGPSRKADFEWLRANGSRYLGRWVALEGGNLVASASSLRKLRELLKALPEVTNPLVHRID